MNFPSRLSKTRKSLEELTLESLIVSNLQDIRYLWGFSGSAALGLLLREKAYLFLDSRYLTQASEEVSECEVIPVTSSAWDALIGRAREAKVSRMGFVSSDISCEQHERLREKMDQVDLVPTPSLVGRLRLVKEREEAEAIRKSGHLLSQTLNEILPLIRPGMREKEVAALIEYSLKLNGADKVSFETIVASGPRSAMPHAQASDRIIESGEFIKIDGGCQWQGYHSDITRTMVWGRATPEREEIHRVVLQAHDEAIGAARPGMRAEDLDAICRKVIEEAGYGSNFGHGTGHGVGLSVHEEPRIARDSKVLLEEGMAFTVEPGIYLPGVGGVRIEDTLLLSAHGAEMVTTTPRGMAL
jgi:Xaa-Pro aminopeptidase